MARRTSRRSGERRGERDSRRGERRGDRRRGRRDDRRERDDDDEYEDQPAAPVAGGNLPLIIAGVVIGLVVIVLFVVMATQKSHRRASRGRPQPLKERKMRIAKDHYLVVWYNEGFRKGETWQRYAGGRNPDAGELDALVKRYAVEASTPQEFYASFKDGFMEGSGFNKARGK